MVSSTGKGHGCFIYPWVESFLFQNTVLMPFLKRILLMWTIFKLTELVTNIASVLCFDFLAGMHVGS